MPFCMGLRFTLLDRASMLGFVVLHRDEAGPILANRTRLHANPKTLSRSVYYYLTTTMQGPTYLTTPKQSAIKSYNNLAPIMKVPNPTNSYENHQGPISIMKVRTFSLCCSFFWLDSLKLRILEGNPNRNYNATPLTPCRPPFSRDGPLLTTP